MHIILMLTAKLRAEGQEGPSSDAERLKYDEQLGRRLPMTAFLELVLNETSGKRNKHYCI